MEQYIIALITAVIGGISMAVRQWLQTKIKPQQFGAVMAFASDAVAAAEQAGVHLGWDGPAKYEYAQTALESLAKRVGVNLKPEEANAIIHSALKGFKDVTAYGQKAIDDSYNKGANDGISTLLAEINNQVSANSAVAPDTAEADNQSTLAGI
jgi:hypothetical protein